MAEEGKHSALSSVSGLKIALLLGPSLVVAAMAVMFSLQRIEQTRRLQVEFSAALTDLTYARIEIDHSLGYGGFIHNFKNAVLRPQERQAYVEAARLNSGAVLAALAQMEVILPEAAPEIDVLRREHLRYLANLDVIQSNITLPPQELDQLVRLPDEEALVALEASLEAAIDELQGKLTDLIEEAENLLIYLAVALCAVIVAVGVSVAIIVRYSRQLRAHQFEQAQHALITQTIESLSAGIVIVDVQGTILRINEKAKSSFSSMFDVDEDGVITPSVHLWDHMTRMAAFRDAFMGQIVDDKLLEYLHPSGDVQYIGVIAGAQIIYDGRPAYIVELRDLTRLYLADQMSQRNSNLASVGQIVGGVAHDMRNLLGALRMSLSTIAHRAEDRQDLKEPIRLCEQTVQAGHDLSQRLLSMASGDQGDVGRIDVVQVINLAMALARAQIPSGHHIQFTAPKDHPEVLCSHNALLNAIVNIILNASEAMSEHGQSEGDISIRVQEAVALFDWPAWNVEIQDTGPGFSQEYLQHKDELFYTTKDTGTGIGLSLVRALADSAAGYIDLLNAPEGGAIVRLVMAKHDSSMLYDGELVEDPQKTALILEDSQPLRHVLKSGLSRWGYTAYAFENGDMAHDFLTENPVDIVITDLDVPGHRTGFDLVNLALSQEAPPPVVVYSGMTGARLSALDQTRISYIKKSQGPLVLERAIEAALKQQTS